jgi:uncharacterized protein YoxC
VTDWTPVLDVSFGLGVLLVGIGVLIGGIALARTLGRVNRTLDVVDAQITALGEPVGKTLDHVGGVADTADQTLARLRGVVDALESTLTPSIANLGAVIVGVTAGLRKIVTGRSDVDE